MSTKNEMQLCQRCGLQKPLHSFYVGRDPSGNALYGVICENCRAHLAEEDDAESGGKKRDLAITHENRDIDALLQKEKTEEAESEVVLYFEEQDEIKLRNEPEETRQQATIEQPPPTKQAPGLFTPNKKTLPPSQFSTAFSYDQAIHDPARQKQVMSLSETTYNANSAREDVRLARRNANRANSYRHGNFLGNDNLKTAQQAKAKVITNKTDMFKAQNLKTQNQKQAQQTKANNEEKASRSISYIKKTWGSK